MTTDYDRAQAHIEATARQIATDEAVLGMTPTNDKVDQSGADERLRISQALMALYDSKKEAHGVHGQIIGMESYVIKATGNSLCVLLDAANMLANFRPTQAYDDLALQSQTAQAVGLSSDAIECLKDVISHHGVHLQSLQHSKLESMNDDGDEDDASYFDHEIVVLHRMKAQAERAIAAPQQAVAANCESSGTEYGWLVENGRNPPDLRYRTMDNSGITWTDDHNKALRFARRADAEMFAAEDEDAWRIAQHAWHSNVASTNQPVQAKALTDAEIIAAFNRFKYSHHPAIDYYDIPSEELVSALRALLASQPSALPSAINHELRYATLLAKAIWEKHYRESAPHWEPFPDLIGVISQIDNMTCRLELKPSAQADVAAVRDAAQRFMTIASTVRGEDESDLTAAQMTEFDRARHALDNALKSAAPTAQPQGDGVKP